MNFFYGDVERTMNYFNEIKPVEIFPTIDNFNAFENEALSDGEHQLETSFF